MKKKHFKHMLLAIVVACSMFPLAAHDQKPTITIFIHGILPVQSHFSIANFIRFLRDKVENTTYSKTIEYMREDSFFYQSQAMQEVGLHKIDPSLREPGYASGAMAFVFDQINTLLDNQQQMTYYYTFGWSGLLSHKQRCSDAKSLLLHLKQELEQLKNQSIEPKIRIIGYSHGGNVALNLANASKELDTFILIDELILLACPIQHETDYLINHPMFKKVYNFYSRGDRVQQLDLSSSGRFFSGNKFKERRGFKLPDKLIQVQLRITKRNGNKLAENLNFDDKNKRLLLGTALFLRDMSPGHIELWSFGWTPVRYRRTFPLYPLPMVGVFPYILHHIRDYELNNKITKHTPLVVDIRPDYQVLVVRNKKEPYNHQVIPFIQQDFFTHIRSALEHFRPENYTKDEYKSHISTANKKAREWKKEFKKVKKAL